MSSLQPEREPSSELDVAGLLDFQNPELWEVISVVISHPVHGISDTAAQTDGDNHVIK